MRKLLCNNMSPFPSSSTSASHQEERSIVRRPLLLSSLLIQIIVVFVIFIVFCSYGSCKGIALCWFIRIIITFSLAKFRYNLCEVPSVLPPNNTHYSRPNKSEAKFSFGPTFALLTIHHKIPCRPATPLLSPADEESVCNLQLSAGLLAVNTLFTHTQRAGGAGSGRRWNLASNFATIRR